MTANNFTLAREIVTLRRGKKRIIFNANLVNPIYFPAGGDKVLAIIEKLKEYDNFSSLSEDLCSKELFDFLCFHSIIIPEDLNRTELKRGCSECGLTNGLSRQKSIYLLLSHSCNQACIYCLNGINTYKKEKTLMMSEDVAFRSLENTIRTIMDDGRLEIVFFGGEPLLNWPLAKKIITYCETELLPKNPGKQIAYHLTTNLTLFPDDLIETAKRYNMTFLVNVDGPEDIHDKTRPFVNGKGTFKITASNIEKLVNAGLNVALRATVTSYNQCRMIDVAKTHRELGGSGCAFVPLNPVDSDIKLLPREICPSPVKLASGLKEVFRSNIWPIEQLYPFNEYLGRLKPFYRNQWGCGAPLGNTPVITSSGEIFSCIYLVGNKKYEVGHISHGDFPRKKVLEEMTDLVNVNNRKDCGKCGFRYLCGGGCPVGVFSITGNPEATPEMKRYVRKISCTVSKTLLNELFWHMAENLNPITQE